MKQIDGQLSLFEELKEPPIDKSIFNGIKGISEIEYKLPHYKVTFKYTDDCKFKYAKKVCIYEGNHNWHSFDGWIYKTSEIESYEEINFKKGDCYRWLV